VAVKELEFCGLTLATKAHGGIEISAGKLVADLAAKVAFYPTPDCVTTPLKRKGVEELRRPPTEKDPLETAMSVDDPTLSLQETAMSVVGLGGWIAQACRADAMLGFIALAQQICKNFKESTWRAVLRWAHYIVDTAERRVMCFNPPESATGWMASGDASCVNAQDEEGQLAGSFSGWTLHFPGSAPFAYGCVVLRGLGSASAHSELRIHVHAAKILVAFRILAAELGLRHDGPTSLMGDSKAAFEGSLMDKMPLKERFLAAQKAMLRLWIRDQVIKFVRVPHDALRPDIMSKSDHTEQEFESLAHWIQRGVRRCPKTR